MWSRAAAAGVSRLQTSSYFSSTLRSYRIDAPFSPPNFSPIFLCAARAAAVRAQLRLGLSFPISLLLSTPVFLRISRSAVRRRARHLAVRAAAAAAVQRRRRRFALVPSISGGGVSLPMVPSREEEAVVRRLKDGEKEAAKHQRRTAAAAAGDVIQAPRASCGLFPLDFSLLLSNTARLARLAPRLASRCVWLALDMTEEVGFGSEFPTAKDGSNQRTSGGAWR